MKTITSRYRQLADPSRTERLVELGLLVLCALLVLQLMFGMVAVLLPSAPEPVYPTEDSLAVSQVALAPVPDAEQRGEIRQRPLFWATRRSLEPVAGVEQAVVDNSGEEKPGKITGTKLTGVFGAGDSAGIIVISNGKKHRVMVGETIDGWKLKSVSPTEAVLSSRGKDAKLELVRGKLAVAAPEDGKGTAAPQSEETPKPKAKKKDKGRGTLTLGRS